ncbi:aquaporin [Candidatus Woesebacteria bacterium]|nr:aquaporin [Candidatus Woesebacteria bacterium]
MKKYAAEFFGTFILSLVVGMSLAAGNFPISTPALAAVTLGLFVYTIGHISGTHLNPAVTLALMSCKKVSGPVGMLYIIAQYAGAVLASRMILYFAGQNELQVLTAARIGLAEALGTFVFAFGIAAVVRAKVAHELSGVVIGGSLLLGIALAGTAGSNGVLNPAVALAISSGNMQYFIGPIFGAILGMQFFTWLDTSKK